MKTEKRNTVAIATLGCKVNQYESASFISGFKERGVEVVPFSKAADIYVINSCAVTGKAGAQTRQTVRKALRINPEARIIVTGCYAQVATQKVLEIADHPICIVGNGNKHLLVDIALSNKLCDLEIYMGDIGRKKEICELPVKGFGGRTRAYLKIQDGCNNFCTYCIVPYARGRVRSLAPEMVLEQLSVFAKEGFKELVFTGIHVGMYGSDLEPKLTMLDLMRQVATQNNTMRYRISSLEPGELSDELLAFLTDSAQFMPHFHLPLQSGDPQILKRMNRKYSAEQFEQVVQKVLVAMPHAAIGLDVLVGFPGETEAMFRNTVDLIERLPITYLHVFPYSKRPGTVAEKMPKQIPGAIKDARVAELKKLDAKKRVTFYSSQIGGVYKVLAEGKKNSLNKMRGFTENYVPVYFEAPNSMENELVDVRIDRLEELNVFGTVIV